MTGLTGLTRLVNARIVTGAGDADQLAIEGSTIAAVGNSAGDADRGEAAGEVVDLGGALVVPGFVDLHCHGGGGHTFLTDDPDEAAATAGFHLANGTTTGMCSLVTERLDPLERQVRALLPLVDDGVVAGLHLEGPWISRECKGAHNEALLRAPAPDEVDRLLTAGDGRIRMVTLAPELDGGIDAVRRVADANAIAAIGHSAASYDLAQTALAAGASVGTHLFNGMKPLHHRTPGTVGALLNSADVTAELICDGHHLHPATIKLAIDHLGAQRTALITDAMTAAGMPDGDYQLGERAVQVRGGLVRLAGLGPDASIAGSTLTMAAAFAFVAGVVGRPVAEVVQMASVTPARVLGRDDIGVLAPGRRADLVVLDDALQVSRVMKAGQWVRR
jgi:N-acetylglucosamine-6-phosphate deacetylase